MQKNLNFYKDIKSAILAKMITQKQMAKVLGVTQPTYAHIENGRTTHLELDFLFKISRILNLDLNKYANNLNILDDLKLIGEDNKQKLLNTQRIKL